MFLRGTEPESYITEYTLVYEDGSRFIINQIKYSKFSTKGQHTGRARMCLRPSAHKRPQTGRYARCQSVGEKTSQGIVNFMKSPN